MLTGIPIKIFGKFKLKEFHLPSCLFEKELAAELLTNFHRNFFQWFLSEYQLEKSSCKVVRKKINSCEMVTQHCVFVLIEFWSTWTATTEQQHQLNKPLIWPLLALWQIALDNCFPTRGWKSWKERTTNDENPPPAPTKSAAGRSTVGSNSQNPAKNYIKNSGNWLPATIWQLLNMKSTKWLETEEMRICWNFFVNSRKITSRELYFGGF